jgi:hypothetical protein
LSKLLTKRALSGREFLNKLVTREGMSKLLTKGALSGREFLNKLVTREGMSKLLRKEPPDLDRRARNKAHRDP